MQCFLLRFKNEIRVPNWKQLKKKVCGSKSVQFGEGFYKEVNLMESALSYVSSRVKSSIIETFVGGFLLLFLFIL